MKKTLFIFGTRPEAIKLAPLIRKMKAVPSFEVRCCVTAQHREMLDQVLGFFEIKPDYDLNLMSPGQTLFDITARGLKGIEGALKEYRPGLIFVQGDTTTAFVGALAGYYEKIDVAHIEAGLRSFNRYSPFPEEVNRALIGRLASHHFAPTDLAKENLEREGIKDRVYTVGNTAIDALFLALDIIKSRGEEGFRDFFRFADLSKKIILVTGHRRESFGRPFEEICLALKEIAGKFRDVEIIYPVHLNPNVRGPVHSILKGCERVRLIEPLDYPRLIWLMERSYLVLTDSGGIQEEAPSLGKPVLVMREVTERVEGIREGSAVLVGTDRNKIVTETSRLLTDRDAYNAMARARNPYGDGHAADRIIEVLSKS